MPTPHSPPKPEFDESPLRKLYFTTTLLTAIKDNNSLRIQSIIEEDVDDEIDMNGNDSGLLQLAVLVGHYETVKLLVEKGAGFGPEYPDVMLNSLRYERLEVVRLFIEKGYDPNDLTNDMLDLLIRNFGEKSVELLDLFVSNGLDLDSKGRYLSLEAVMWNKLSVLKFLSEKGIDLISQLYVSDPPIREFMNYVSVPFLVARKGLVQMLEYLVELGLDINHDNGIIVREACNGNQLQILVMAHKLGANLYNLNQASMPSSMVYQNEGITRFLVGIESPIVNMKIALNYSFSKGNVPMIEFLVEKGAVLDELQLRIRNAIGVGFLEVVSYLYRFGAILEGKDLIYAMDYHRIEIVKFYIGNGVFCDKILNEVLTIAKVGGNDELVEVLRSEGVYSYKLILPQRIKN